MTENNSLEEAIGRNSSNEKASNLEIQAYFIINEEKKDSKSIFKEYYRPLCNYLLKLTKDKEKARDLAMDTFIKAIKNYEKFASNTNFKAWIYKIAYNLFSTDYQREKLHKVVKEDKDLEDFTRYNLIDPEKDAICKHELIILHEKLSVVNSAYLEVLILKAQGNSYKNIGKILGAPPGTIMSRLYRARNMAAKILDKERKNLKEKLI